MTVVIDCSALVWASTESVPSAASLRARLGSEVVHAPHLVDAELGNVLRRKVLRGELEPEQAAAVLWAAPALIDVRHPHSGRLAAAAWELRDNLSFYDALFVALAAGLGAPLLTADGRLAASPNLPCRVEMVVQI